MTNALSGLVSYWNVLNISIVTECFIILPNILIMKREYFNQFTSKYTHVKN